MNKDTLLKIAELLIFFSIIYFLWATASFDTLLVGLHSVPFIGPLLAGSQPSAAWLATFNQTYYGAFYNLTAQLNNSIATGTQLYLQDINASIIVARNGTVYANVSSCMDSPYVIIYFYNRVAWKYMCINSLFVDRQICKNTYSNFSEQYVESTRNSMRMNLQSQEAAGTSFAIPMDINGHGGMLDSFSYAYTPSDDYLSTLLTTNPDEIYKIGSDYEETYTIIDFNEITTKCLRFAISRFSRVRVNVTMPGPIIHYAIPSQFLNESIVGTNSVYVDYNPYPCCGKLFAEKINVEVCS